MRAVRTGDVGRMENLICNQMPMSTFASELDYGWWRTDDGNSNRSRGRPQEYLHSPAAAQDGGRPWTTQQVYRSTKIRVENYKHLVRANMR